MSGITYDHALAAVYVNAIAMLRNNGVDEGDFQSYPDNVTEAITEFRVAYDLLSTAADRDSSDDEIQVLTEELYEKTLVVAMGGMLLLGSFPLFSLINKAAPAEVTHQCLI